LESVYSTESFQHAMTAAGYNEGNTVDVELLVAEGNAFRLSAAKAIAAALSVYDLNVTVKTLPYWEYIAALQAGNFDFYYGEVRMTPDFNCAALVQTGGSLNYGRFSDAALDAQIATAFTTATAPVSANEAMFKSLQSSVPIAPICFKSSSVLLQSGVVDAITPTYSDPFYQLSDWQIHIKEDSTNG
jgi:peptide/nickel transport system substrate-binding protein